MVVKLLEPEELSPTAGTTRGLWREEVGVYKVGHDAGTFRWWGRMQRTGEGVGGGEMKREELAVGEELVSGEHGDGMVEAELKVRRGEIRGGI